MDEDSVPTGYRRIRTTERHPVASDLSSEDRAQAVLGNVDDRIPVLLRWCVQRKIENEEPEAAQPAPPTESDRLRTLGGITRFQVLSVNYTVSITPIISKNRGTFMTTEVIMGNADAESAIEEEPNATSPEEPLAIGAIRLVYQTNNFTLRLLNDLIDKGLIFNVRPECQRRLRWTRLQKSRLIESLLLNIPIPPVFLYESDDSKYEVMDGQQRLNAVQEFFSGEFTLRGLPILKRLNGRDYSTLSLQMKRILSNATLSTTVLLLENRLGQSTAPLFTRRDVRRFVFDRLNTGGAKLNPQEIRNALNPGIFNRTIIEITRLPIFTHVFEIPPYTESDPNDYYENPQRRKNNLYSKMGDCQLVLRYFALRDDNNIRGSMKSMLDRAMATKITEDQGESLKTNYEERFQFLFQLFDKRPFLLEPDDRRFQRISAAIYDASMVAIDDLWSKRDSISDDKLGVQVRMRTAIRSEDTKIILTGQQNSAEFVRARIDLVRQIFHP